MLLIQQNVAGNVPLFMITAATGIIIGITGLTLTVTSSKAGAAFASISPTVLELSGGWYNIALTAAMTDTIGSLIIRATAGAGAQISLPAVVQIVGFDPTSVAVGTDYTTKYSRRA